MRPLGLLDSAHLLADARTVRPGDSGNIHRIFARYVAVLERRDGGEDLHQIFCEWGRLHSCGGIFWLAPSHRGRTFSVEKPVLHSDRVFDECHVDAHIK